MSHARLSVLFRLLKIFKIAKLAQLTVPLEGFFGSAQVAVARLIFTFIAIFHATACGFHLMAILLPKEDSWIKTQGLDDEYVIYRYRFRHRFWALLALSDVVCRRASRRAGA